MHRCPSPTTHVTKLLTITAVLELLGRCNADLALRVVAAALVVVVVLPCIALLLALLLTSLVLVLLPLGRPVEAEGIDECRRSVGLAEDGDGLHGNVNLDEREYAHA
eukprot:scaffold48783_cov70-Phaeocystis_antarctica.AAC.1